MFTRGGGLAHAYQYYRVRVFALIVLAILEASIMISYAVAQQVRYNYTICSGDVMVIGLEAGKEEVNGIKLPYNWLRIEIQVSDCIVRDVSSYLASGGCSSRVLVPIETMNFSTSGDKARILLWRLPAKTAVLLAIHCDSRKTLILFSPIAVNADNEEEAKNMKPQGGGTRGEQVTSSIGVESTLTKVPGKEHRFTLGLSLLDTIYIVLAVTAIILLAYYTIRVRRQRQYLS